MSDTDDHDPNDEFWEKVGEYHDPERFFIKCMEKCGATVIKDGDYLEIIGGCNNLVFHTDTMMQEIFCTKCGGSVSVIEVTDINGEDIINSVDTSDTDEESDDMDEFLNRLG